MLPGASYVDRSTGFFVLLIKRNSFLKDETDEDYRRIRANLTYAYALNLLFHVKHLERVVGIATEGELDNKYRSEDVIYAEVPNWTKEMIDEVQTMAEAMEIFKAGPPDGLTGTHIRPQEYPPSHYPSNGGVAVGYEYAPERTRPLNRQQRRARKSRRR